MRSRRLARCLAAALLLGAAGCAPRPAAEPEEERLAVLFLGDDGHHRPWERARTLLPVFAERGIDVFYRDDPAALEASLLGAYDVLMLYNNQPAITPEQLQALLGFVAGGGGLVVIHSASASFQNSEAFIRLVGGAFAAHGTGTFSTVTVEPDHPAVQGVPDFESWDETYVHQKHNPDRTVLSVRRDEHGDEPWTWVRTYGDGRIFYTAWGHDLRTWSNEGFQRLLERGTRWAAGDHALALEPAAAPLGYTTLETPLPNYPAGEPWATEDEPIREAQEPLSPDESRRLMVLPPGFRAELFAAEPDIVNPIDLGWDERGRLFVLETVDYPNNLVEDGEGNDRLLMLEDTDGNGRADRVTVFAEGLNIPTSLTFSRGGVIVTQAPHTLFLQDTTGDGRADVREVLFSGWRTFDTHAGPSNLRYGLDNHIWGSVGYSGFEGTVGGEDVDFPQGVFRFAPDGSRLEYLTRTSNNTWGLGMSEEGYVFVSTANRRPSQFLHIPNRYYRSVRGWEPPMLETISDRADIFPLRSDIRQVDAHGLYTAGAGHELYTARRYPREFWNRAAFIAEPTGHLLGRWELSPSGTAFRAKNRWNFLASRDGWSAPVQARVGPDGFLWVLDWYNLVIQHNPTPEAFERGEGNAYETPLRDRSHGRIYRIVHEEAPGEEPVRLDEAPPELLVRTLSHPNLFWRNTAQRLLVERGQPDVAPRLVGLLADQSLDEVGLNAGALHALWTLEGLGLVESDPSVRDAIRGALAHPSHAVRRAAVTVLPRDADLVGHLVDAGIVPGRPEREGIDYTVPAGLRMDAHPQVRLAALLALSEVPTSPEAARVVADLIRVPENARDAWIADAAVVAGARHDAPFLEEMRAWSPPSGADSAFVAGLRHILTTVTRHASSGGDGGPRP